MRSFRGQRRGGRRPGALSLRSSRIELLEPRVVLDARVLITELVASNDHGLRDEDGDRPDWLELYNAGDAVANLDGWHLTDDADDLDKWRLPAVTLDPGQFRIVFASGKDRIDPAATLHTNFRLTSRGEYLALVEPNATTIAFEHASGFPALTADVGYGVTQANRDTIAIPEGATATAFVPTVDNGGDQLGTSWTEIGFDDANWLSGPTGVGFERSSGYEELIGLDLDGPMYRIATSVFIRIPFDVAAPSAVHSLLLRMKYEDGFVAYINGVEAARRNAPEEITFESEATSLNSDSAAVVFEDIDASSLIGHLQPGENVLAIHGLNRGLSSNDLLFLPELRVGLPGEITSETGRYIEQPSPGRPNGEVTYGGLMSPVELSHERGFYDQPIDLALTNQTPGSTIVYTTNGSVPTANNGTRITPADAETAPAGTVNIAGPTVLRVTALKDDFLTTEVPTHSYVFINKVRDQDFQATLDAGFAPVWRTDRFGPDYGVDPKLIGPNDLFEGRFAAQFEDALAALPTISIVTDFSNLFGDTGILSNPDKSGIAWERPASMELIHPDGTEGFQIDAGVRVQGDASRDDSNSLKKSLRFVFRRQYGEPTLEYPVFGPGAATEFNTIRLRANYNDGSVHTPLSTQQMRDEWMRRTLLAMDRPQAHGTFMHVYINGFYWGFYNVVERPDGAFSESYFGGDKDNWDSISAAQAINGTTSKWRELGRMSTAVRRAETQVESNALYQEILGNHPDGSDNPELENLLDVDNYIDYLIANFYGGNGDWPGRNYIAGRERGPDSTGFKFFSWDAEKVLGHEEGATVNANRLNANSDVAQFYVGLLGNDEFRLQFADRVQQHFFNGGALFVDPDNPAWDPENPHHNLPAARYQQLADLIELPLVGELARWGDTDRRSADELPDGTQRLITPDTWAAFRDDLFANYFPQRSAIVLDQFRAAGLFPTVDAPVFSQHGGDIAPGFNLTLDGDGEIYYTLDGSDPRRNSFGGEAGVADTAIRYDGTVTLDQATVVKARALVDGQWSALNVAAFSLGTSTLRISEVHYHPREPLLGQPGVDNDYEFAEIVNTSTTNSVDLTGVRIAGGIQFTFPAMQLQPGERTVVIANQEAFTQRYGSQVNVAGVYEASLSNGGETLRLEDAIGQVIHEFTYVDRWVPTTDGGGRSLTILDVNGPLEAWNEASGWRASTVLDGSPGTDDTIADFNNDQLVDAQDIDLFCAAHRSGNVQFDLTGDGAVDQGDLDFLVQHLLHTSYGDTDLNGRFDSDDLLNAVASGEYGDEVAGNSTWSEGDWNCDGDFNSDDVLLAFATGNYFVPAAVAGRVSRAAAAAAIDRTPHGLSNQDTSDKVLDLQTASHQDSEPRRRLVEVNAVDRLFDYESEL